MKKFALLFISLIALAIALPAGAAPEKLKLSDPMVAPKVAAVDTAKANPSTTKEAKKAKKVAAKAKKAKANDTLGGPSKKKPA